MKAIDAAPAWLVFFGTLVLTALIAWWMDRRRP